MQIISDYSKTPDAAANNVIALGNFDGVHKGHVEVIKTAVNIAKSNNVPSSIMTFEPHPIRLFKPGVSYYRLTSADKKAEIFEGLGVDFLYRVNFNRDFSKITARQFIEDILLNKMAASHVVTGSDFIFGYNKGGNVETLEEFSQKHGFGYTKVEEIGDGERFSSSKIRNELKQANLEKAVAMLGRNYVISGKIIKGDNRGHSIGFPTVNVEMGEYLRPKYGVYAVNIVIEGGSAIYKGVANLGVKPTFNGTEESLEVHIFDFNQDVYGKIADVEFLRYVRGEKKFNNADELVVQIQKDCEAARA
jgi:riboflavin kinase/FMN adenylyltransferase